MVHTPSRSVVSGQPLVILRLPDGTASTLEALADSPWFVVHVDGEEYRVCGEGWLADGCVRFHEKSQSGYGKDVRVWTLRSQNGRVTATP